MKTKLISTIIATLVIFMGIVIPLPVFGTALYTGSLNVTNNSTATTNVATVFTINSQALIDNAMCASDFSDVSITYNGIQEYFMPGWIGNPWCVYVPTIGTTTINYILQSKAATGGLIRYFPGATGMSLADPASLEVGSNGTVAFTDTFLDTTYSDDYDYFNKLGAIYCAPSSNVTGTVKAAIGLRDHFYTDNWTDVGTPKIYVDTTSQNLSYEGERSAVDNRAYFDLTSISNISWNLDFEFYNTVTTTPGVGYIATGLFSAASNPNGFAGDYIATYMYSATPSMYIVCIDGGGAPITSGVINIADNVTYYATLKRNSTVLATLSIFSDATRTTHITGSPVTLAIPATVTGLRYLQVSNYNDNTGAANEIIGTMDNIEIDRVATTLSSITSGEYDPRAGISSPFFWLSTSDTGTPPVTTGLVLNAPLWQTECSTSPFTTVDSSAFSANVTGATWTSSGYSFSGGVNYITFGTIPLNWTTANWTIEVWASVDATAASAGSFVGNRFGVGAANWFSFGYDGGTHLKLEVTGGVSVSLPDPRGLGVRFYTLKKSGNTMTIYINTVSSATLDITAVNIGGLTNELRFGHWFAASYLKGFIGEVRLYSSVLTVAQDTQDYNATRSKYSGHSTGATTSVYSTTLSVPDNTANYYLGSDRTLYIKDMSVYVAGVLKDIWNWIYGLTRTGTVTGNIGTFTFRSTSSDSDVSATLSSFGPTSTSDLGSFSFSGDLPDIGVPDTPGQMYTEGDYTHIPGADSVNAMLGAGGIPYSLWWYPFIYLFIGLIGLMIYGATQGPMAQRSTNNPFDGSLLIMAVVMEVLIVIVGIMNPVPLWPAYLFPIPALAIISSRKHQSLG